MDLLRPDAIFTSLPSLGVGIDAALLATAEVPTFALRDFWGDVNLGQVFPADLYPIMDNFATKLSRKRWGVKALGVDAPKYILYKNLDIMAIRHETRGLLGAKPDEDEKVIDWFGQSPTILGYEEVFLHFLKPLTLVPEKPELVLKEHPKSSEVRN